MLASVSELGLVPVIVAAASPYALFALSAYRLE